jgi:hypothetical protein
MTRSGRIELAVLAAIVIVVVAFVSHAYGKWLARGDILDRDLTIQRLQGEGDKLEATLEAQMANIEALQAKLKQLQATLDAMMPAEHTYNINPNQSLIVAGGHLTIGLVGSPTNEYVNININGKQQSAAAGTVLNVAPDPATSCAVTIQSFDMFKAIVAASCEAKPK